MGLKTTNYEAKEIGQTLPTAYAILDGLHKEKNSVLATFGVYASRENASLYEPIDKKSIHFHWDRKSNLAEQAYSLAKGENGIFSGWLDDRV